MVKPATPRALLADRLGWRMGRRIGLAHVVGGLMADQDGVAAFTLVLRQRLTPPASMVLGLFGSRM